MTHPYRQAATRLERRIPQCNREWLIKEGEGEDLMLLGDGVSSMQPVRITQEENSEALSVLFNNQAASSHGGVV